ncbi:hypothetical protein [Pseudanabaena sp. UWO311]|uniref:hypothetical protein n=1 Tax=Pseudanabaena sp. UWO311 TaxID=2487337 RepID=UPI001680AD94|nr:hypothetical protein [Pseudanabaena sp. UWO311]
MAEPFDVSTTLDGFDPQFTKVWRDFGEMLHRSKLCLDCKTQKSSGGATLLGFML